MFELFYWHGGHGGPYTDLSEALQGAIRFLNGLPYDECVLIHPRDCDACHGNGFTAPNTRCTKNFFMVCRTLHVCNCGACESNGREVFYKVRA